MMRISVLLRHLNMSHRYSGPDREISLITYDSRKVREGAIFVAIRGERHDGHQYIAEAFSRGAVLCVCEKDPGERYPHICVPDSRQALAEFSYAFYCPQGLPYPLLGVTGTNGKTTITHLLYQLAEVAGLKPALIGTLGVKSWEENHEAERTTPESSDLAACFHHFTKRGADALFMEVSSHAIALKRVHGLIFDTAVFTNLTRDHLDFHQDMESYFHIKSRLFHHIKDGGYAVINTGDAYGRRLKTDVPGPLLSYAVNDTKADVSFSSLSISVRGISGTLKTPQGNITVNTPLLAHFNAENIAAAIAAWQVTFPGVTLDINAFPFRPVAGRMERVATRRGTAVIDYAHTPDAMGKALEAAAKLEGVERLITVFGCGGDRDKGKRPQMGALADRYSDHIIICNDNPRNEDPSAIAGDILRGIKSKDKTEVILDRAEAIKKGYRISGPGDLLMILGKGAEHYMEIKGERIPFEDKTIILGLE
jgi:UDP-N-acetylmuramoyl-L-alanyl-D-glutamate--2,6-diaminopimelate ligase